jgi:XapX domain-containing protein
MTTPTNFYHYCHQLWERNNMKDVLISTLTGFGCGVVFAAFKLPVPAPPVFAGVAGIIGLWIGFTTLTQIIS